MLIKALDTRLAGTSVPAAKPIDRRRLLALAGGAAVAGLAGAAVAGASAAVAAPATDPRPEPRLVRLWAQAWNTGDADLMASLFTPDGTYIDHAFQATFQGRDGIRMSVMFTLLGVPDARVVVNEAVQAGDRAVARWTFSGTYATVEPFTAGDPRGRSFSVPVLSYFTLAGDHIASIEEFYNLADLMRQLGLPVAYMPRPA
ncbi:MAG TPA: SgcJ/EcaC family oxidoreductase [Micromonosporaceae bacterium]